jgi:L-threonylcarbamoyladenylate synthase
MKNIWNNKNLIKVLKNNGIAVMPTDTIYGIVARAEDKPAVERIYKIRQRNPEKPCIILIGKISELKKFGVSLSQKQKFQLKKYWPLGRAQGFQPGPVSVVLDCKADKLKYLHRGTKTLAFRMPNIRELRDLLLQAGPLLAPSANLEALPPSKNITEAKKYFGHQVDLYVDGGEILGLPSKIIQLHKDGSVSIIRE